MELLQKRILLRQPLITTKEEYEEGIRNASFAEGRTAGLTEGTLIGKKEVFDFVMGLIDTDGMTVTFIEASLKEEYPELVPPPINP